ncbi:MAG: hypothetical protein EOP85_03335 [Verrucomicrobiaceae bacterium]|nr:MAG: hypothetical protein EOP85_03335 [Verrucomicrobiaceae bacterium]
MTPIDPAQPATTDPKNSMAPPYVDEDPNLALVEEGVEVAENEMRDAVADDYEANALESADVDAELDDIDFTAAEDDSTSPELSAIHEEGILPEDEDAR